MLRRTFMTICGGSAINAMVATTSAGQSDDILLTVINGDTETALTDAALMELPQVSFQTSTIWTASEQTFSGPSLHSVLDLVGAGPGPVRLTAVNDYAITIPRKDIEGSAPIVANRINSAAFNTRQKGPLWLVYPYDSDIRYQTEEIFAFSIWQLTQIEVLSD